MLKILVLLLMNISFVCASGEVPEADKSDVKEKRTRAHLRKLSLDDVGDLSAIADEAVRKKMEAKREPLAPRLPIVQETDKEGEKK